VRVDLMDSTRRRGTISIEYRGPYCSTMVLGVHAS
jgi:hypothetical protein